MYEITIDDAYLKLMSIRDNYKNECYELGNLTSLSFETMAAYDRAGFDRIGRVKFFKTLLITNSLLNISLINPHHHLFNYLHFFGPVEYLSFQATDGGRILGCAENKTIEQVEECPIYIIDEEEFNKILNSYDDKIRRPLDEIIAILKYWEWKDIITLSYMICRNDIFHKKNQFDSWRDINSNLLITTLSINLENLLYLWRPRIINQMNPKKAMKIDYSKITFLKNNRIECLKNGTINPIITYLGVYLLNRNGISVGVGNKNLIRLLSCRLLYPDRYKRIGFRDEEEQMKIASKVLADCLLQLEAIGLIKYKNREIVCQARSIKISVKPKEIDFEKIYEEINETIPRVGLLNDCFRIRK